MSSSLGDDGNKGTTANPVKTMGKAFELAQGASLRVYACAEEFTEGALVPRGVILFGGLDCSKGWSYVGAEAKTKVTAPAEQVAVRLLGANGGGTTEIHDVHAQAASAVMPGGSSIAMLAEGGAAVKLVRSVLEAGNGAAGAAGEPYGAAAMGGVNGTDGKMSCMAVGTGPEGPSITCDDGITFGGKGGDGAESSGSQGGNGSPVGAMNGGAGEAGSACKPGTIGDTGLAGMAGSDAMGMGTLDGTGYRGVDGTPGVPGKRGQGGGGGGGSISIKSGLNQCGAGSGKKGASGGSGASGGCGGAGGNGGGFGGSSIALVSLGATLSFEGVTLLAGDGGAGGDGGEGQEGGAGGVSGGPGGSAPEALLADGCSGGPGGAGGNGGKGGRGLGGHSIGLAYTGVQPTVEGVTVQKKGTPGAGGGVAADRQAFSSP